MLGSSGAGGLADSREKETPAGESPESWGSGTTDGQVVHV